MPFYLFQASYTPEALRAMVANPQNREDSARPLIESIGGKLHHLFFSFGSDDIVALIEAPDDQAMAAGALVVGASGAFSAGRTTRLMSAQDAMKAMGSAQKAATSYKPVTS